MRASATDGRLALFYLHVAKPVQAMLDVPPSTASLFTHDGATLAYALPASMPPRALLLVAHGCRNSGRNWFHSAPPFGTPVRSSLPEESCVTSHALAAGFGVLAPTARADCWSAADVPAVDALLRAWRSSRQPALPAALPLLAFGTSSGGYFAHLVARQWPTVAAVSSMPSSDRSIPGPAENRVGRLLTRSGPASG